MIKRDGCASSLRCACKSSQCRCCNFSLVYKFYQDCNVMWKPSLVKNWLIVFYHATKMKKLNYWFTPVGSKNTFLISLSQTWPSFPDSMRISCRRHFIQETKNLVFKLLHFIWHDCSKIVSLDGELSALLPLWIVFKYRSTSIIQWDCVIGGRVLFSLLYVSIPDW